MAAHQPGAADNRGDVVRHRRVSPLRRVAEAARGRTVYAAAGVIVLGAVFGVTTAVPDDASTAQRSSGAAAGLALPQREQAPVTSRGQRRTAPATLEAKTPLARAPQVSPSPSPPPSRPATAAPPPAPPTEVPEDCEAYSGNRLIACTMLPDYGFGIDQMPALDNLWTRESGWNELAQNPSSGAYGIPQALPGDKMASCGDDWRTNPATQICWGLGYIRDRYGDPDAAWAHFQAQGWY